MATAWANGMPGCVTTTPGRSAMASKPRMACGVATTWRPECSASAVLRLEPPPEVMGSTKVCARSRSADSCSSESTPAGWMRRAFSGPQWVYQADDRMCSVTLPASTTFCTGDSAAMHSPNDSQKPDTLGGWALATYSAKGSGPSTCRQWSRSVGVLVQALTPLGASTMGACVQPSVCARSCCVTVATRSACAALCCSRARMPSSRGWPSRTLYCAKMACLRWVSMFCEP